jgi:beta-lactamase regulating signal transducer with metallopeptidase domain
MATHEITLAILDALWRASWQAAVLGGLVMGLRLALGPRLLSKWRSWLWMLVLARALLPAVPSAAWSVFNLFPKTQTRDLGTQIEFPTKVVWFESAAQMPEPASVSQTASTPINWAEIVLFVWLGGFSVIAGRELWINLRFARRVRRFSRPLPAECTAILEGCARDFGMQKLPVALVTDCVSTPCLFGPIRPRILVPAGFCEGFSAEEIRFVFLHELAHLKRRDLPVVCLGAIARAVHWFNPMIWVAIRTWRGDMENACDDAVLTVDAPHKAEYGMTLVKLATTTVAAPPLPALGIIGGDGQLKRRIVRIAEFGRLASRWYVLGSGIVLLLLLLGLTDARGGDSTAPATTPSGFVTRVYDATDIVPASEKGPTHSPLEPDVAADPIQLPPTTQPEAAMSINDLAALVRQNISSLDPNHVVTIDTLHRQLVVTAPNKVHEAIEQILKDVRQNIGIRIQINARIFELEPSVLANAGLPSPQPPTPGDKEAVAVVLTADQADRILHLPTLATGTRPAGLPSGPFAYTPRVILFNNQCAEMYQLTYIPYVGGLNISGSGPQMIAAPVVQTAHDGIAIYVQARTDGPNRPTALALSVKTMKLLKFETEAVPSPADNPSVKLSKQVALRDDHSAKTTVLVPAGDSAMLAISEKQFVVVSLKVLPNN